MRRRPKLKPMIAVGMIFAALIILLVVKAAVISNVLNKSVGW